MGRYEKRLRKNWKQYLINLLNLGYTTENKTLNKKENFLKT